MTISQIKKGLHKTSKALPYLNEAIKTVYHNNGDTVMLQSLREARSNLRLSIVRLIEVLPNGEIMHSALYNECRNIPAHATVPAETTIPVDHKTTAAGRD